MKKTRIDRSTTVDDFIYIKTLGRNATIPSECSWYSLSESGRKHVGKQVNEEWILSLEKRELQRLNKAWTGNRSKRNETIESIQEKVIECFNSLEESLNENENDTNTEQINPMEVEEISTSKVIPLTIHTSDRVEDKVYYEGSPPNSNGTDTHTHFSIISSMILDLDEKLSREKDPQVLSTVVEYQDCLISKLDNLENRMALIESNIAQISEKTNLIFALVSNPIYAKVLLGEEESSYEDYIQNLKDIGDMTTGEIREYLQSVGCKEGKNVYYRQALLRIAEQRNQFLKEVSETCKKYEIDADRAAKALKLKDKLGGNLALAVKHTI